MEWKNEIDLEKFSFQNTIATSWKFWPHCAILSLGMVLYGYFMHQFSYILGWIGTPSEILHLNKFIAPIFLIFFYFFIYGFFMFNRKEHIFTWLINDHGCLFILHICLFGIKWNHLKLRPEFSKNSSTNLSSSTFDGNWSCLEMSYYQKQITWISKQEITLLITNE